MLKYNWEGYAELVRMVEKHCLKLQVAVSFHQCGGNVGDSCRYKCTSPFASHFQLPKQQHSVLDSKFFALTKMVFQT